ncbi:hypothetical protein O3P69_008692 [Scylla paramamosain]|uniref:Uncharacterized protein n=1 Tax=Scylla paramamosain TaxID=85552 RepID=A0AAW0SN34_SCYPA
MYIASVLTRRRWRGVGRLDVVRGTCVAPPSPSPFTAAAAAGALNVRQTSATGAPSPGHPRIAKPPPGILTQPCEHDEGGVEELTALSYCSWSPSLEDLKSSTPRNHKTLKTLKTQDPTPEDPKSPGTQEPKCK